MKKTAVLLVVGLLPLALACNPISKQAKRDLEKPVNCSTAPGDIQILQKEKASVAEQVINGATAVTPAGAAIGILTMTEDEKLEVAVGEYNRKIDAKIKQIKETCGIR